MSSQGMAKNQDKAVVSLLQKGLTAQKRRNKIKSMVPIHINKFALVTYMFLFVFLMLLFVFSTYTVTQDLTPWNMAASNVQRDQFNNRNFFIILALILISVYLTTAKTAQPETSYFLQEVSWGTQNTEQH